MTNIELNIKNLENAVGKMGTLSERHVSKPSYLMLSNAAIKMGFDAELAQRFIDYELQDNKDNGRERENEDWSYDD